MIKKLLISAFLLSFITPHAFAQEEQTFVPPGSKWVNKAQERIRILNQQSMEEEGGIIPQELHLSVVRYNYMEPDQFGLLMKAPQTVTGCFDLSPISYKAKFIADLYMDIEVDSYKVTPTKTQNVEYACNQGYKTATGLIVLSANDLKERGTRQIRFTNGSARDNYNIMFDGDKIMLQPESMLVFKSDKGGLSYDMNGANIVALEVPMAQDGDDVAQAVRSIAAKNGLNPVNDTSILPPNTAVKSNVFYYIDELGRYTDSVNEKGYAELGAIPVSRLFIDENGQGQTTVPLKVFVKKL